MFILFALTVIGWSLIVLRWTFTRKARAAWIALPTCLLFAAATASIASDLRHIREARTATPSRLTVRIQPRDAWWQLDYGTFVTANELHVPAGARITLAWRDLPSPWIAGAPCIPDGVDRCTLTGGDAREVRFVRLWPPLFRRLRIVSEPLPQFERWRREQTQPARGGSALFVNAGCGDCHVVRGVTESPAFVAPDLTHFASRATIGGTELPNQLATLEGWIASSRSLKPHSRMPDMPLAPPDLHAVAQYVESLR